MYDNFKSLSDTITNTIIGIFGNNHLLEKHSYEINKYNFQAKEQQHKERRTTLTQFYGLFSENLKERSYKIAILAFKIKKPNSYFQIEKKHQHLINENERSYLNKLLEEKNVIRISSNAPKDQLSNFKKHFDYLILYKESIVPW
jgi:hypothetical protein